MTVKPIRTDADYKTSLARLEALIDAETGTPDGDELEILAALIERYEDERFPIQAPTPIEAIRFRMEQQRLTPKDLEPYIGSRGRVSEVLQGERPLSIDMIRALNKHLGIPAGVLIQADPVPQAKSAGDLSVTALRLLSSWGAMKKNEDFSAFIARAFDGTPASALLRKTRTERTNAKTDFTAVEAWCAACILRSYQVKVHGSFEKRRLTFTFVRELAKLSARDDGPLAAVQRLSDFGVAVVALPHLPGTYLDGAAMLRPDGTPVIAMTLRRDRIDNFWFTLLHELAHVKVHLKAGSPVFVDDLEIGAVIDSEREADDMATEALIPPELWETFDSGTYTSTAQLLEFAERAEVNAAIVAGRWQRQNHDFRKFSKLLGHGTISSQFDLPASR